MPKRRRKPSPRARATARRARSTRPKAPKRRPARRPVRRPAARRPVAAKKRSAPKKPARPGKPAARRKTARTRRVAAAGGARPTAAPRAKTAPPRPKAKPEAGSRATPASPPAARPVLDRARRQLSAEERGTRDLATDDRLLASARSGGEELRHHIEQHPEAGPALTAGDVDANWVDAYSVGDEAPGGDNPTPDQDRVDDIGKALGVNYDVDEELKGSDKIAERDKHRWELDPASSDDWPHDRD